MKGGTMKKLLDYLPSLHDITQGMFLITLGLLTLEGSGFAVRSSSEFEPHWIMFPKLDAWACWTLIWFGLDSAVSGSRITTFVLSKTLKPLVRGAVESIRGKKLGTRENEDTNARS